MKRKPVRDIPASVHQRLLNLAREKNADFNTILKRYALERLMYRIGRSPYASAFVLKGALLFEVWSEEPFRSTEDMDFLHLGSVTIPELEAIFRAVCLGLGDEDGLIFLKETVKAEEIREEKAYGGVRVTLQALLGAARISLQVDVGLGDAVSPEPQNADFPTLLGQPAPLIAMYSRETAIAEKFESMVVLGMPNSRMKDFFDIWVLMNRFSFEGDTLAQAIQGTFRRRRTPLPATPPMALTPDFSRDTQKLTQWRAFLQRGRLQTPTPEFAVVVGDIAGFLMPPTAAAAHDGGFPMIWPPKGPWKAK